MDPDLWGTLPEPLIELILAYLPLPKLLQMRSLCRKWNCLLQSPNFLDAQRRTAAQCHFYVVTVSEPAFSAFSYYQKGPELHYLRSSSLYCHTSQTWFNLSLNFLPFSDLYVTSVGGGLICFVAYMGKSNVTTREVVIGIANPATRTWRLLPRWEDNTVCRNLPNFVAMVVDNFTRQYRVVAIDYDKTCTYMYSSVSMSWAESKDVPTQHNFPYYDRTPSQAVVTSTNKLVCTTQCKSGVSIYDMDTGLWDSYEVHLPGMHSNVHLVQHRGRILMISRIMKAKYEGSDRVQISELERKDLRVTKALDEVPVGPSKHFLDHFKVCDIVGPNDDSQHGMCFVSVITGERWVYDLEGRFWRIMPSWPRARSKSMAAYGGFSIQLRVDIQP
nr:hypothetical protein PHYPA_015257 [Physcomitrium patens]